MIETNLYYPLWKRYLPVFAIQLKKALSEEQEINFTKSDFHSLGNRNKSDYGFSLELENGKAKNNISGSAVARDLYEVLLNDAKIKELLQGKHYKISMGKAYILKIVAIVKPEAE
ncbi:hypothetical protein A5893_03355 [Pedobacter psychrophilus]|uniref:Uncharacterized protein n=1 Tax=Pedobacter psychrophilus TaxID=1826909 RepID=A0A179DM84_9SPHI|nr:hypothetical protein [Pedobacter psychrophilus]OAQ42166.1 hypothetical protein A5893_03355 [Pedobacter psychrophilus]